jgi:Cys-tRNA(Pro) deacylase
MVAARFAPLWGLLSLGESSTIKDMSEQPPVSQALSALDIPHEVFTHPGPVSSLQQAAAERGQQPEQVVRSLLFRLGEGDYAMVLMAGPAQVSWKALRRHVGQSRLTTASEEEVLAVTGYTRGAVAPFGLRQPVRVLIDHGVMEQEIISLGSGIRGSAVILTTADLRRALPDAEFGDFQGE